MKFEVLEDELCRLENLLAEHDIELIVGGGMGLYLWETYVERETASAYPEALFLRPTNDLDLILTGNLIVDRQKIEALRDAIGEMEYEVNPEAKYFQFERELEEGASVKIDVLTAPPSDPANAKVNGPRVRPHETSGIHGRLTPEAAHIDFRPVPVEIEDSQIWVPSAFNFVILKLHAFRDRYEDDDMNLGRHHALDIYRIVAGMGEQDWETAREHRESYSEAHYLTEARRIRREHFDADTDWGVVRLQEHATFEEQRQELEPSLERFVADLEGLLGGS